MKSWRLWEGRWLALGHAAWHLPPKSYLLQPHPLLRAMNDVFRWDGPGLAALSPSSHRLWLPSWATEAVVVQSLSCGNSLWPHTLQHTRLPCPHYLLEFAQIHVHWVDGAIHLSHSLPFSSCPQPFPASGSFPMNWFFASGGQSIGASVSALVLPMNIQGWFPSFIILPWFSVIFVSWVH